MGLAVDGHGSVWFSGPFGLARYRPGEAIQGVPLPSNAFAQTFRSAPDGSVWFAEPTRGSLGRIALDGTVTLGRVYDGINNHPFFGLAVGPDGSVWYDDDRGVARLRPDGRVTTYPVEALWSITVDSHGTAWLEDAHMPGVVRISNSGAIAESPFPNTIRQMAEAPDGHMWFVDVPRALPNTTPLPRVGWIDAKGQPMFFDARNADDVGFPNSIVRAPDGAVWFGTYDGRLIRLASETDVTVYSLPWSDAPLGPFVVLAGNRIVMLSNDPTRVCDRSHDCGARSPITPGVEGQYLLDFTAVNGTRVAGVQAIPAFSPPQHVPSDPAEGAAYAAAVKQIGLNSKIVYDQSWKGDRAVVFEYDVNPGRGVQTIASEFVEVYVVEDAGVWRKYDIYTWLFAVPPRPGWLDVLKFGSGCLAVHVSGSKASKVVDCLASGTSIQIDGLPAYADDGYIWWHLDSHGWVAHPFLFCTQHLDANRPECQ